MINNRRGIDSRLIATKKRREKMRDCLIEAATLVFAERGPENTVIDHIVLQAGVSRGSFYNYFRSIEELLETAKRELAQQMIQIVTQVALTKTDPAEQLAIGMGGFVQIAVEYPIFLQFSTKLGTRGLGDGSYIRTIAPQVIQTGIETGRFNKMPEQVAIDILEAIGLSIMRRQNETDQVDAAPYIAALLRMMGLPEAEADDIANRPIPTIPIPPDSLIARSAAHLTAAP